MILLNVHSLALQNSLYIGFHILFENDIYCYVRNIDELNELLFRKP